jgi:hypothetical protein
VPEIYFISAAGRVFALCLCGCEGSILLKRASTEGRPPVAYLVVPGFAVRRNGCFRAAALDSKTQNFSSDYA